MKRMSTKLLCCLFVSMLGICSAGAQEEECIEGSQRSYRFLWRNKYLDFVDDLYSSDKLTLTQVPFFTVGDSLRQVQLPMTVFEGSEIWENEDALIIKGKYEMSDNTDDWMLKVAATLRYRDKDLIRDTLFVASGPRFFFPSHYLDTNILDFNRDSLLSDDISARAHSVSWINRFVLDICTNQRDSIVLSELQKLPQEDALTYYLKALRLSRKCDVSLRIMKSRIFNREEDPFLRFATDNTVIVPSDSIYKEWIAELEKRIKELKLVKTDFETFGLADFVQDIDEELKTAEHELTELRNIGQKECLVEVNIYEVFVEYLKRCFVLENSFVEMAKHDSFIPYEILEKLVGEDLAPVKVTHVGYVLPELERRVNKIVADRCFATLINEVDRLAYRVEESLLEIEKDTEQKSFEMDYFFNYVQSIINYHRNDLTAKQIKKVERYRDKKLNYLMELL